MNPEINHTLAPSPSARLTLEQKLQILGDDMPIPKDRESLNEREAHEVLDVFCRHIDRQETLREIIKDLYHNTDTTLSFCDMIAEIWSVIK